MRECSVWTGAVLWVRDVRRREAIALGVIGPEDAPPEPGQKDFNAAQEASLRGLDDEQVGFLQEAFGDKLQLVDGKATWKSGAQLMEDMYRQAIQAGAEAKGVVNLGKMPLETGTQLGAKQALNKQVRANDLWHIHKEHGKGNESDPSQVEITPEMMPYIYMTMEMPEGRRPEKRSHDVLWRIIPNVGRVEVLVMITRSKLILRNAWIKRTGPHGNAQNESQDQ